MNRLKPPQPCNKLFRLTGKEIGSDWLQRILVLDQTVAEHGHWHRHPGIEITCRLDGEGDYEFREHATVALPASHAIVIPSMTQHRLAHEIDAPGHRIGLIIAPKVASFSSGSVFTAQSYRSFIGDLLKRAYRPFRCTESLFHKFFHLANLTRQNSETALSPQDMTRLRILSADIICDLAMSEDRPRGHSTPLIGKALDYLEKHLSDKIHMDDLVTYMGYGQSQFFMLFKKATGMTPNAWLGNERVKRAKKLLRSTDLSLHDIAERCGFASDTYFFTSFRKNTGLTPIAFRSKGKGR